MAGIISIVIFSVDDGSKPLDDWLDALRDRRAAVRIRTRIERIRDGNFGDFKMLGKGVSELRCDFGPGYRIYFGRDANTLVILLCGGDKDTQSGDIQTTQVFWEIYLRRKSR